MDKVKILTTTEQVKAISDPFRYRILMTFYKMKQPSTVKEVAVAMDVVPANVHYHVKKMEKAGILKLMYTKEINGIIAKYYQPTAETFNIKCSPELDASSKKLLLAESQKTIGQLYEDSKNTFIEQLDENSKNDEIIPGTVGLGDLYLTKEEAENFRVYIQNFMDKYENSNRKIEDVNRYHCFFSFFKIK